MTTKDAYQYFVLKAQEIAISKSWTPVNWYALIYLNGVVCYLNLILLLYCVCVCIYIYGLVWICLRVWKVLGYQHKVCKWKILEKLKLEVHSLRKP
jgi:hypothetical protein